jgi:histidyl-tRNA synthetase
MVSPVNPPRGMRDFLPQDARARDRVRRVIEDTYRLHGFDSIDTPAMEDHAILHSGLGGDNEKLSFGVLRRGLELEDVTAVKRVDELSDLALRFDLTVPLARYYASHHQDLPPFFRALHIGPVWRAERPQKGRFRQFVQCDIDIVGEQTALAEQEVLTATADALEKLGVHTFTFRVGDRRLLTSLLATAQVPMDDQLTALIILDKLDKIGSGGVLAELRERLGPHVDTDVFEPVLEWAQADHGRWDAEEIASLMGADVSVAHELAAWAQALGDSIGPDRVVFDPTLVRGMGYYTGSIVECVHPGLGVSLGGGGRYDGMIGRFLGQDTPAFGFSLGFERLMEVVTPPASDTQKRVALMYGPDVSPNLLLEMKRQLVDAGTSVVLAKSQKNQKALYERLVLQGVTEVATVSNDGADAGGLSWRILDA